MRPAVTAALVGVITGVGGGVLRDVLLSEIPTVLRREIYALAAAVGAAVVVVGDALGLPPLPVALGAAVLVAGVRLLALWRRWNAPTPRTDDRRAPTIIPALPGRGGLPGRPWSTTPSGTSSTPS